MAFLGACAGFYGDYVHNRHMKRKGGDEFSGYTARGSPLSRDGQLECVQQIRPF